MYLDRGCRLFTIGARQSPVNGDRASLGDRGHRGGRPAIDGGDKRSRDGRCPAIAQRHRPSPRRHWHRLLQRELSATASLPA